MSEEIEAAEKEDPNDDYMSPERRFLLDVSSESMVLSRELRLSSSKINVARLNEIELLPRQSSEPLTSECFLSASFYKKTKILNQLAARKKRIVLNVGGERFETYRSTLKLIKDSRLGNLSFTNSEYNPVSKEFFFDRDPASFASILNYYRTGKLHAPNTICGNQFYQELSFWGIDERCIEPCCWTDYSTKRDCNEIIRKVLHGYDNDGKFDYIIFCYFKIVS
jgi:hypothetical protein